jgi:hypothetical protein
MARGEHGRRCRPRHGPCPECPGFPGAEGPLKGGHVPTARPPGASTGSPGLLSPVQPSGAGLGGGPPGQGRHGGLTGGLPHSGHGLALARSPTEPTGRAPLGRHKPLGPGGIPPAGVSPDIPASLSFGHLRRPGGKVRPGRAEEGVPEGRGPYRALGERVYCVPGCSPHRCRAGREISPTPIDRDGCVEPAPCAISSPSPTCGSGTWSSLSS